MILEGMGDQYIQSILPQETQNNDSNDGDMSPILSDEPNIFKKNDPFKVNPLIVTLSS
jgi:hypothetical protein